jgi:hypothetical protein
MRESQTRVFTMWLSCQAAGTKICSKIGICHRRKRTESKESMGEQNPVCARPSHPFQGATSCSNRWLITYDTDTPSAPSRPCAPIFHPNIPAIPHCSNGQPITYDTYTTQRSHGVQSSIRLATGDQRMMSPVAYVENHHNCRTNRAGDKVLPNGVVSLFARAPAYAFLSGGAFGSWRWGKGFEKPFWW